MSDSTAALPRRSIAAARRRAPAAGRATLPASRWVPLGVLVGVLAFGLRLQLEVRGGGLLGIGAYDDGVHLSAAAAMVHGRVPYRDFLFLQPPGMLLAAAPFAAVAHLIGDPAALAGFRVAFEAVGAASAVLIVLVLRRFGLAAAATGGFLYAVFAPAVYDERTALLEPAGTLAILVALLLLPRAVHGGRVAAYGVGAALGIACDFKIWYVVTALVVLAFAKGARIRVLVGTVVAGALVYLPFLVPAPRQLIQQVVLDQLGRPRNVGWDLWYRLRSLLGVSGIHSRSPFTGVPPNGLLAVLLLIVVGAGVVACLDARTRVFAVIAAADFVVVLASPSYFPHYAALTAPLLALLLGASVGRLTARLRRRGGRIALVAVVLIAVGLLNVQHDLVRVDVRPPGAALRTAATRIPGCIVADDPTILLVMDVLTRDLDHGCPLRPDVSGYSYGPDAVVVHGVPVARELNATYQDDVVGYLRSGTAFIRVRKDTQLSAASVAALDAAPARFRSGTYVIRGSGD